MVIAVWCDDSGFSLDTAGEGFSMDLLTGVCDKTNSLFQRTLRLLFFILFRGQVSKFKSGHLLMSG